MKKLYLIRHAKSSWLEEGVDDFDRPLKGSGIRDAHNTSQWLFQQAYGSYFCKKPALSISKHKNQGGDLRGPTGGHL
jgi:hypothetical protein